ncbi:AaceriAAR051Cp [[Ashbya] aceris (nom. inval.)]|nr:AaceriAAR051Cp [[Ashbya] aceris (nom. inval.)]
MPRSPRSPPPAGFDKVEPTLAAFAQQLRDLQSASAPRGPRASASAWPVFRVAHERSRYVYTMYHRRRAISRDLYDWLLRHRYADRYLIAKWRKQGYEKLCCLRCIQPGESQYGHTCICRVPRAALEQQSGADFEQCTRCGCRGCASTD